MRTVRIDLEKEFTCIANKCPATCCKGWQICVDDNSLERYEKYKGKIPEKVREAIDFEEGTICQKEDNKCYFLNDNGLCDWIIADGEEILCDTCRLYPRHVEEYEDLREWSLSLSCPEVARLFAERKTRISLSTEDDDEPDSLEDEFEDFDIFLFENLLAAREVIFKILERDEADFIVKAANILLLAKNLQNCYDADETFEMSNVISVFSFDEKIDLSITEELLGHFDILKSLERLRDDWDDILLPACEKVSSGKLGSKLNGGEYSLLFDNLLFYFIYTYFLGAVYNGMIYGYTALCVFSVLAIDKIAISEEKADFSKILYRFSRELEHSDDNLSIVLEHFDALC